MGRVVVNSQLQSSNLQSAPPEEYPFVDETVYVIFDVIYIVPVRLVAKTFIKQDVSSDQYQGFITITFHRNCLLFRLFLAESTEREAIALSWSELSEFVGETNFLCDQLSSIVWWSVVVRESIMIRRSW